MPSNLVTLVKINVSNTGSGAITLGSAAEGYRGREVLTNGTVYSYSIRQGSAWEFGRGTYLSESAQLVRSVIDSSDGGAAISLRPNAQVSLTAIAEDLMPQTQLTAEIQADREAAEAAKDLAETAAGTATTQAGNSASSATLSQEWAEGTEPGGPGTKSAKGHAEEAAQSAAYAGGFETPEYASQSAGEAATTAGQIFRVPLGTTPQTFNWYRRLSSGSELVSPLATTAYLASSAGAGAVGFVQAGTGAVSRTAQAKLRDIVSVKDFGAVGDGVTDDTAAIQAAINFVAAARKALVWPAGVYMVDTLPTPQDGAKWIADGEVIIRRRPSSTANVLLLASNKIECAGITFDGNKANNAVACNAVIVTASASHFSRCRFINAKAVSGGFGAGISYNEAAVTDDSDHALWDCYAYFNDAQGFAGQNIRGLEAIGNTAHSNGKSGFEFNNYETALTKKLYDCRVIGNYSYDNGENGIYIGNFIEGNNLSILDYGSANLDSYRFAIEGNVCRNNNFYGIAVQGESISISGNICVANAQSDPSTGGILMNATRSVVMGNLVSANLGFGIDAGGSEYTMVCNNNIYVNAGTGLNMGATVNSAAKGNHLYANGGANGLQVEVHNVDTDAAGRAFPSLTFGLAIAQNHIVLAATGQKGVYLHDGVTGVNVCDNDFYGTVPANMIVDIGKRTIIKNNRVPSEIARLVSVGGGGVVSLPNVFDFVFTDSATTVTSLDFHPAQNVVGRTGIAWVEVTNGGTGYTSAPSVVFTGGGGTGAAATAHIRKGVVVGVRMTNFGTGYTSAPSVAFTGGGGTGATGTAQVSVPLNDLRELELMTLQPCTINRAGNPVVESKGAANLSMAANDGVKLRALFGQWYVGPRHG